MSKATVLWLGMLASCAGAQSAARGMAHTDTAEASRPAPTGTVTGRVQCADTQRPARLAQVRLVRVPAAADKPVDGATDGAAMSSDPVETSLDGTYTVRNVKPGQYFVVVDLEGYLIPLSAFSQKELSATDDATRARVAAVAHSLTVAADQTSREDVTLERGASLSGTVLYDDGSPASRIGIQLLVPNPAHTDESSKEPR